MLASYSAYPPQQQTYPAATSYPHYPQQYAPPQPQPPNPHAMTPEEFRRWYASKLSELVVNNRNIIQTLAFIASDNAHRLSVIVSDCIELHIRRAHPQTKLPAWYLLDSIAKNVGQPYVPLFSTFIVRVFLDSYYAVDLPTRSKMEEMLVTWRTGGPGGYELFGIDAQTTIERGVWSAPSTSTTSSISRSSGLTKAQVLTELEVTLAQKLQVLKINPNDEDALGHVDALNQLRALIQTSVVSQEELSKIATQLRTLARSAASAAPPLPPMVPPPQAVYPPPQTQQQAVYPTVAAGTGVYPPPVSSSASYNSHVSVSSTPSSVPTVQAAPAIAPILPAPSDISALFQNLVKAGVVTAPATSSTSTLAFTLPSLSSLSSLLAASGLAPKTESESSSTITVVVDPRSSAEKAYEKLILNMDVPITSVGIQRERPEVVSLLYERLSVQCKQCALRFPNDSQESKKKYEDHIDMHFRQNLRNATASTSTAGVGTMGRGYTRSWFVGKEDWVHDVTRDTMAGSSDSSTNDKGKGRAISPTGGVKVNTEERDAKLRASYVVVPPGDEAKSIKCPICKESLKTEFLEDDEDWVWRNAVSIKGKIYHATCHADAITSNLARVKTEVTGRSRSATPETAARSGKLEDSSVTQSPGPSPLAGAKRKVADREEEDASSSVSQTTAVSRTSSDVLIKVEETERSPRPFKKVAMGVCVFTLEHVITELSITQSALAEAATSKMETAVMIPEIIGSIIQTADSRTQCCTARLNKRWSEAALDSIWRCLNSIVPLLRLLVRIHTALQLYYAYKRFKTVGTDEKGTVSLDKEFEHLPSAEGWVRFRRIAPRVRTLTVHDEQTIDGRELSHLSSFVFVDIAAMHAGPLLPNLRELEWHVIRMDTPFSLLFMFLAPHLRKLSLEIDINDISPNSFCNLFRHLTTWTPLLTHFSLYSNVPATSVQGDLSYMIKSLRSLEVVGLPPYHHTETIVEALAVAPALKEVRTGWLAAPPNPDDTHADFKEGWFRTLERIDLEISPQRAINLLHSDFRPATLTRLRLTYGIGNDADQLERFLSAVASSIPNLTLMSLNLWGPHIPLPPPLVFNTFRPLLACRQITYFELGHNQPLQLEESHVEELAVAWPKLEEFMVCEDPVVTPDGPKGLSLKLLPLFAQKFPELQVLALYLDGTPHRPEVPAAAFQHLFELNVGTSKLDAKHAMTVALYLSDLCRLPVTIIKGKSAWHVTGVWDLEEDDSMYISSGSAWSEVGRAIKSIHSHQKRKEKSRRRQSQSATQALNDDERELLAKFRAKNTDLEAKVKQLEAALASSRISPPL
ncbi:hypothetical protein FRB97_000558 [Tulasnella sp. 331]|nr:hypothetical protein FRB97_000558 [Tulasnella sp. 331]